MGLLMSWSRQWPQETWPDSRPERGVPALHRPRVVPPAAGMPRTEGSQTQRKEQSRAKQPPQMQRETSTQINDR